jgi:hypothetical protein
LNTCKKHLKHNAHIYYLQIARYLLFTIAEECNPQIQKSYLLAKWHIRNRKIRVSIPTRSGLKMIFWCDLEPKVFKGLCQRLPSSPMTLKVFAKNCQVRQCFQRSLPKTATFEQMFLTDFAKNCQV